MKGSTVAHNLHSKLPALLARAIERRIDSGRLMPNGFASCLSDEDLLEFGGQESLLSELNRLRSLVARGLWVDEPKHPKGIVGTTPVRGDRPVSQPERRSEPFQPLPDEYMELIGPRVLWLIKDLGPNLIDLLSHLVQILEERQVTTTRSISTYIIDYFALHTWRDRTGREIASPPFPLRLSLLGVGLRPGRLAHAWPPRGYADVLSLAATLQRAHLFMSLLLMTSRQSEMSALRRDCIAVAADGKTHVNGKTFKPTNLLLGKDREWPAPSILVQSIAQQVELVELSERLARLRAGAKATSEIKVEGHLTSKGDALHLWASLGVSGAADATASLEHLGDALPPLARAVGVDDRPGGINLHPHRLRKAPRRFVWKPTATIGGGRSAVWACGQVAERLVHMPMRPCSA